MKVIINNRGAGKAKQLLEAAKKTPNFFILTQNKRALQEKAKGYGFKGIKIIDYEDLNNGNYPITGIMFIHNVEQCLEFLIDYYYISKVGGFTATLEENNYAINK